MFWLHQKIQVIDVFFKDIGKSKKKITDHSTIKPMKSSLSTQIVFPFIFLDWQWPSLK